VKRSKPGEEMSVAELADLTWRVVKLKVAIIAIRWSGRLGRSLSVGSLPGQHGRACSCSESPNGCTEAGD
jgi:hypothetical protein